MSLCNSSFPLPLSPLFSPLPLSPLFSPLPLSQVRNGDSIVYLYASPLPRLFSPALLSDRQPNYNRQKLRKLVKEKRHMYSTTTQ